MFRIKAVRIQNFRSIEDSGKVDLDEDMTALIGKNESGKTNFLKALYSFNQDYSYDEDEICNINNRRQAFLGSHSEDEIPITSVWFEDELNFSFLEKDQTLHFEELKVTKYFDGHYEMKANKPEVSVEKYPKNFESFLLEDARNDVLNALEKMENNDNFDNEFGNQINKGNYQKYRDTLKNGQITVDEFDELLSNLVEELNRMHNEARNNNSQNSVNKARNKVENKREEAKDLKKTVNNSQIEAGGDIIKFDIPKENNTLLNQLPNFIFHENVDHLEDQLKLNELINSNSKIEHRTFQNLLSLTNLNPDRLNKTDPGQRLPLTRKASTEITGLVNDSWDQESLEIDINVDGDMLSIYLHDGSGSMDQPSKRSKGFQWFLGFYINFTAGTQGEFENSILLLDDPGVYLHPSGQKDLLDTLAELTDENQIIYNTHSPFLIDKDRLDRIRILEKKQDGNGTKVRSEFHHNEGDVLAPVRAALGASLADSLFGNRQNILVEGYSDKILIEAISTYFRRRNRSETSIDPDKVSVINVGGADKMPYFAKLINKEGYEYIALLDDDTKGRKAKTDLTNETETSEDQVYLLSDLVDGFGGVEAEIEDLFDNEFYYSAVISAYEDIFNDEKIEMVKMEDIPDTSIAKKFSTHFEEQNLGRFDKITVAKEIKAITEKEDCKDEQLGEATIESFRAVFEEINSAFE